MGGGVCWWHSRLQRSSAYLVEFDDKKEKPNAAELKRILLALRHMDQVVTIPGFTDFHSFSSFYKKEIQGMLNDWQKFDGFFNFQWIRGISGQSSLRPQLLKARMDLVFHSFKNSPSPLWLMAQMKGVTSHSLLMTDMRESSQGYVLTVIDSNYPLETLELYYQEGDTSIRHSEEEYTFVPYVGFQYDYKKIFSAIDRKCENKNNLSLSGPIALGEVEL